MNKLDRAFLKALREYDLLKMKQLASMGVSFDAIFEARWISVVGTKSGFIGVTGMRLHNVTDESLQNAFVELTDHRYEVVIDLGSMYLKRGTKNHK